MKAQITYRHLQHSPAMDARINEMMARLEALNPRITSCHVIVDEVDKHKEKGRLFEVRIDVKAPHAELVASHQRHEDPYVALNDAYDVVVRQLTETVDRQRGEVKRHQDERGDNAIP